MLIYDTPQADLIVSKAQGAVRLHNGFAAVPVSLYNLQILSWLGHQVIPPMANYDWPSRGITPFHAQRVTANFLSLHPRAFVLNDMGCVDAETEYLSPTGWRRIDQYDGGRVAQYHLDGRAEYVQPTEYVVRPCNWMWRFKNSRGIDQKLSDEHRVLAFKFGKRVVQPAGQVAFDQERLANGWRGKIPTTFTGGGSGIPISEEELRLQIAVIADGYFPNLTHRAVVRIKKERKKQRLRSLLDKARATYTETMPEYESAKGFSIFRFAAPRHDKEFGEWYWNASAEQLKIIVDEVQHWDGAQRKAGGKGFYSTSKVSADFIQYAYSATGWTASISNDGRGCWCVNASKRTSVGLAGVRDDGSKTEPISVEPTTDGKKYCFVVPTSFLLFRRNGCIFASGNTGKTLAALWAADFLMRQITKGEFRCLIVAPLSTLQRVWADAIFNHFMGRRSCVVLHGTPEQRLKALAEPHDFYITNFDGLAVGAPARRSEGGRSFFAALEQRTDIKLALVDEASAYRDPTTRRHLVARRLLATRPYLWMMTGTPTPNGPVDAYGLAKLVNNAHGETMLSYRERVMMKISQFKWVPRSGAMTEARKLLQPAVRFAIEDCIDLPPCTTQQRDVEFSPEQTKAFNAMKRDLQVTIKDGRPITAVNEAVLRMKLIQISSGAIYGAEREVHRVDAAPRINALKEILDQTESKIVVFAPLTSVLHMLHTELKKDWSCEIINGSVTMKARGPIFTRFLTEKDPHILLCDPATTAHGINEMVAAQVIVWYAPTEKTELYLQANKRIDRPGQTKPTTIIQLASTAIEREIYRRLGANESLQGAMLGMVRGEKS